MLRRSLRCLLPALEDTMKSLSGVWNLHFQTATTQQMNFNFQKDGPVAAPMYHITDLDGKVINEKDLPTDEELPKDKARHMLKMMITQNVADRYLLDSQRIGIISFYMTSFGEEAAVVGSIAGIRDDDYVFMQYREAAGIRYRGASWSEMIAQCMGNCEDKAKGRQMPIHYGSKVLNIQTISSPLATQISQAAGAGYAYKLEKNGKVVICYFGEGAASEGDFHAGLNIASTTGAHTLFFCRNNGFAISTPTQDQYHGDGILPRGIAYGMPSIRVDGNDVLAVYQATRKARQMILDNGTPALIEAMTYRVSHHSTSDDANRYRDKSETQVWETKYNPITRFQNYMVARGWWTPAETEASEEATRAEISAELERQKHLPPFGVEELFSDTFKEPIPSLVRQREETIAHYNRNKDIYEAERHQKHV